MRKTVLLLLLAVTTAVHAAIGTWNTYIAYTGITKIEYTGNMVYVLASGGIYSYTPSDQSIQTYDKNNVLSDCGISDIAWCPQAGRLLIIYDNYNIDMLSPSGNVTNIPDYYNKTMTDDKQINSISINGHNAYLSTGFGILRINMKDGTVSNTYNLGVKVNATVIKGNYIYAATEKGMYKADTGSNLADKDNWNNYSSKSFTHLFLLSGKLIGINNGEAYTVDQNNDSHKKFYTPWFTHAVTSGDRILCYGGRQTYIIKSETDCRSLTDTQYTGMAYTRTENTYWVSGEGETLDRMTIADNGTATLEGAGVKPDGPDYNFFGFMRHMNGRLYTAGGNGNPERPACIQTYSRNEGWNVYDNSFAQTLDHRYSTAYSVDIDPKDPDHLFMGSQSGLYEFNKGKMVKNYTIDNSPLQGAFIVVDNNKKNYTLVTSVRFDSEGRLWCLNSAAESASLFNLHNGEWTSLHHRELMSNNVSFSMEHMTDIMFDRNRQLMWFCSKDWRKAALVCYQPSTNEIKLYNNFVNQNGTSFTAERVNCAVEDDNGNIWIGTAAGPFMLTAQTIASGDNYFTQVIVPRNDGTDYGDYLLSGVKISAIAIDGAGRKWFGTENNGVYLISADNMTQIHHFTAANSILLSDVIESIAIDSTTGEVFFGTDKGLCSYMSDATAPADDMDKDNVYAYPNPVKPDYTGPITVTGLSLNADVKIVTAGGALVAEGQSNGGTFIWDGRDKKGQRVASGVYMVLTATADGAKGAVCKIAVIN